MKIYIASSFKLIDKVKAVCDWLEYEGHEITEKWWSRPYTIKSIGTIHTTDLKKIYDGLESDEFYSKPETKSSFELDFVGVKNADAFVFVADDKPRKFNGANIELGIAIGRGIPCLALGELENSVLYFPVIRCRDIYRLLSVLRGIHFKKVDE